MDRAETRFVIDPQFSESSYKCSDIDKINPIERFPSKDFRERRIDDSVAFVKTEQIDYFCSILHVT